MLRTVIIDDEQNIRDVVSLILKKHCPTVEILGTADTVAAGIELIKSKNPDLVLLDIHLQNETGFDLLNKLSPVNFRTIFITAHEEYAVKAFKFSAIDYLLKPINSIELIEAINKVAAAKSPTSEIELGVFNNNQTSKGKELKKIILKTADSIYSVNIREIIRCEADTYYTKFFLPDQQMIMVSTPLKEYDELLSEYGFFRVHQSHLINLDYFTKYKKTDGGFAVLKDGSEIPVSTRKKDLFLEAISNG
jgi:two-component system LytT family response regulator